MSSSGTSEGTAAPADAAPAEAAVAPADAASVQRAAREYVAALQKKDYAGAARLMSPAGRSRLPAGGLEALAQDGLRPFAAAKDLEFEDPPQSLAHGRRLVLRARFVGGDSKPYRTNFLFDRVGPGWALGEVIAPVAPRKPQAASGKPSSH